jgi:hypothetical protein
MTLIGKILVMLSSKKDIMPILLRTVITDSELLMAVLRVGVQTHSSLWFFLDTVYDDTDLMSEITRIISKDDNLLEKLLEIF